MKRLFALLALTTIFATETRTFSVPHPRRDDKIVDFNATIKRLSRHIDLLEQFNTKNKLLKLLPYKTSSGKFVLMDGVIEFTHDLLRICVKKMLHDESLDPLFAVWRLFVGEYRDLDGEIFLRELTVLLFSIYKNIFVAYLQNRAVTSPTIDMAFLHNMIALYQRVSTLPINDILDVLDTCLDQFALIMKDYGFYETANWRIWFKKYWWVSPVVLTSLFFGVINWLAQPEQLGEVHIEA